MFLITTADERFWKTDGPVLFLGEWCKLYSRKEAWGKFYYEVLPYHWSDKEKLFKDYLYLDDLYERTLEELSQHLNRIHNIEKSIRYWRIVTGPWLYYMIQILFDRYQSICAAALSGKVSDTLLGIDSPETMVPNVFSEFISVYQEDSFNQYLYGRIIKHTGKLPYTEIRECINQELKNKVVTNDRATSFRGLGKRLLKIADGIIPAAFKKYALISSGLTKKDLFKLQISLGQFPEIITREAQLPNLSVDMDKREVQLKHETKGEFEELLWKIISEQMPAAYLENYTEIKTLAHNVYPQQPNLILTSTGWYGDDIFKIWAAENAERGVKLCGFQHGGHYGTALYNSDESHELKIYDRYYTWGWKTEGNGETKILPAPKFEKSKKGLSANPEGKLLLVLGVMPRYFYLLYSVPISASDVLEYWNDQYRFVRFLNEKCKESLLVRTYTHDYGWSQKERCKDEMPGINVYNGNISLSEQLREARLFIGTYEATTYLETFSSNFPTILYWNPKHWELRESAKPYFDKLKRAGILHDSPDSAAEKVNEIFPDVKGWWNSDEVQKAKDEFCIRFVNTSDKWIEEWKSEIITFANKN